MKTLHWIDKYLEESLISIILVVISCLMLFQFVFRFFGYSITWSDETCRYLFVWSVGLGIAYTSKKGVHLRMDIIPNLFPKTVKIFEIICDLSLLAASVWMLSPGCKVIVQLLNTGQKGASTGVPMWILYASMMTGFVLTILRLAEKYIKLAIKKGGDDK